MFGFYSYIIAETDDLATVVTTVQGLSNAELIDCFGSTILQRGRGYHRDGRLQIEQVEEEQITAKALGTSSYQTKVFIEGDTLQGQCNCPYEAACKHIAALLLEIKSLPATQESRQSEKITNDAAVFAKALEKLSKETLVAFLKKHATADQRKLIQSKPEPPSISEENFYELQIQIEQLLAGKVLNFSMVNLSLNLLRAYWVKMPLQVAQLLHTVLGLLQDQMTQEGSFSHNFNTPYYHLGLEQYLVDFLLQLSDQDLTNIFPAFWLLAIDQEVDDTLLEDLPNLLIERWPADRDLKILKKIFLTDDLLENTPRVERQQIFNFLRSAMTKTEVLSFLKQRMPEEPYQLWLYAKALLEYGQIPKATQLLDQQIKLQQADPIFRHRGHDVYELRIELAKRHETAELAQTWCKNYLQNIPASRSLEFVVQIFPKYHAWFETLTEERSPTVLFNYLQKNNRIIEAAALLDKYPKEYVLQKQAGVFYSIHKDQFPKKALNALEVTLQEHLNYTGDEAYRATAQVLLDIRSIEPKVAFEQRLAQIKEQFKRRRNMMKVLEELGL